MELYLPNIPHEIIYNILSRLPVKPLCRFKSVSRPWLDLITNPRFIKAHLNQSTKDNMTSKLIVSSLASLSVYSIDYKSPDHTVAERLMFCKTRADVLGSVNGVVLLHTGGEFCLWNPSTKMCLNFSPPCYPNGILVIVYALGYDSVSDDFKVVRAALPWFKVPCSVHVFASKLNSWRRIEDCGYIFSQDERSNVLHGMPHWVASRSTDRSFLGSSIFYMIVCFDATEERFKEVPQPNYEGKDKHIALGVLGGCLCVVQKHQDKDSSADVWVMKEYGVKESWTKLLVVPNGSGEFFFHFFMPLYYTKDGEVVMVLNSEKLVIYNPKEKRFKTIGIPQDREKFDACVYVESLVSPHGGNVTNLPLIR